MESWPWYYWVIGLVMLALAWSLKRRSDSRTEAALAGALGGSAAGAPAAGSVRSQSGSDGALVAVIAAAVAAASGLPADQFRITQVTPSAGGGPGPFNTPPWGYADRFGRNDFHR